MPMRNLVCRRSRVLAVVVMCALLMGVLVGCSSEGDPSAGAAPTSVNGERSSGNAGNGTATPDRTRIATAIESTIAVYESADSAEPMRTIRAADAVTVPDATPLVFTVRSESAGRLEVNLPVRPNGSTGWVEAGDVKLSSTGYRVVVTLSEYRVRVLDGDDVVLDEPVGVGRADRPTPGGVYYVKELLQPPSPDGPYGTYAYGLSGFSNVLESFNGGEAVIGLHGTNEPELVGQDVSSGCIRLTNEAMSRLVEEVGLPLGTPVEIRA